MSKEEDVQRHLDTLKTARQTAADDKTLRVQLDLLATPEGLDRLIETLEQVVLPSDELSIRKALIGGSREHIIPPKEDESVYKRQTTYEPNNPSRKIAVNELAEMMGRLLMQLYPNKYDQVHATRRAHNILRAFRRRMSSLDFSLDKELYKEREATNTPVGDDVWLIDTEAVEEARTVEKIEGTTLEISRVIQDAIEFCLAENKN